MSIDMSMDEPQIITLDTSQNSLESETLVPNKTRLKPSAPSFERTPFEPQKISENRETKLSWVEIVVEDSMDIYQLALKYYNDREGYQNIYSANQNIIGNNLIIEDGMSLKIPIVDNFEEQPIVLNRH